VGVWGGRGWFVQEGGFGAATAALRLRMLLVMFDTDTAHHTLPLSPSLSPNRNVTATEALLQLFKPTAGPPPAAVP